MEDKKNMTNSFELNKKQVTEYPKKQLMHANFQKKRTINEINLIKRHIPLEEIHMKVDY